MAPSDEENKRQKSQDDTNPFILFRRFADQQMSTLMNNIFNISSLFRSPSTPPHRSVEDYEKWLQEARESSQRLTREAEVAGRIMDVYTRAYKDSQRRVQDQDPASDNDSEPLRCPYRSDEWEGQWMEKPDLSICLSDDATRSCFSLAALSLGLPSTTLSGPLLGEQLPSVPVTYLLHSPYSPVRLEQQPRLCDHKWREAFEDLLAVQSGRDLPPKGLQSTPESSVDWMRGMIELAMYKREEEAEGLSSAAGKASEAMKHDPGPFSRFTSPRQPENDADDDEEADSDDLVNEGDAELTEMDMYNRLFGPQEPFSDDTARAAAQSFAHLQQGSPSDINSKSPGVLSTLTTTERTTLQDGSVHIKVVLKKRFANGREESTETVHHQNAVPQTQEVAKPIKDEGDGKIRQDKANKENKFSGWFWS